MDSTRRYYEKHAREYAAKTRTINLTALWKRFTKLLSGGASLLDVGCGSGRDLRKFSSQRFRVVGLDYSVSLIKMARDFSRQPVVVGDMRTMPFRDASFDAAWAIGSYLHLRRGHVSKALNELSRVLRYPGWFLSSVKRGSSHTVDKMGRLTTFYQPKNWTKLLRDSGFIVSDLHISEETRLWTGTSERIQWIVCIARKA